MTDAEKVARLIALLNQAVEETGFTVVGTTTSPLSLRIVRAAGVHRAPGPHDAPSIGATVDAAHFWPSEREWIDGAEDRARRDPEWAKHHWGEDGRRRAGNERLPGQGPTSLDHTQEELQAMATRGGTPGASTDARALVDDWFDGTGLGVAEDSRDSLAGMIERFRTLSHTLSHGGVRNPPLVLEGVLADRSIDCGSGSVSMLTIDDQDIAYTDLADHAGHRVRITLEVLDADPA